MPINLFLEDSNMPRTVFWQMFLDAIVEINNTKCSPADIHVPAEDLAMETNWPRYGQPESAYIRGERHHLEPGGTVATYFTKVVQWAADNPERKVLLINMNPFFRVPIFVSNFSNIYIADVSLSAFDRCFNRNTISMPALPIDSGGHTAIAGPRPVSISFQGVASHPVRIQLAALDNKRDVIINIVNKSIHKELKLDSVAGVRDRAYSKILRETTFALIPRGDALFSYRLLEAMSYGCIPVIISDGWILPFDRQIDWPRTAYFIHEEAVSDYVPILKTIPHDEILKRQNAVIDIWDKFFSSTSRILGSLIAETKLV